MKSVHLENGERIVDIADTKDLILYGKITEKELVSIKTKKIQNLDLSNVTNTALPKRAFYRFNSLVSVILPKNLIAVPAECFSWCEVLEAVDASDSINLSSICHRAFSYCEKLKTIGLPDSVQLIDECAFVQCRMLKIINLPRTLEVIKVSAFLYCSSLVTICLPKSVRIIGDCPFYGCSSLTKIEVEEGNEYFYSINGVLFGKDETLIAFPNKASEEYTIESSVTKIGKYAFSYLSLKAVIFRDPAALTEIDEHAFYICSLETITIPRSVAKIGAQCFGYSDSLVSVGFEEGINILKIPVCAFQYCHSLASVNLPESVTEIGNGAFFECSSLVSINIPGSVDKIGADAFFSCSSLKNILIPKSVRELGISVFSGCISLSEVIFEQGAQLTKIPKKAFYQCPLKTVVLADAITKIGSGAFSSCSLMREITILGVITVVERDIFKDCASLVFIRMNGNSFICESEAHGQLTTKYVVDRSNCCKALIVDVMVLICSQFSCDENATERMGVYHCTQCYYF